MRKKLEAAVIKYKEELEDYKKKDSLAQARPSADTGRPRPVVPLAYDGQSGPPFGGYAQNHCQNEYSQPPYQAYPNFVNMPDFQANQKPKATPKKQLRKNGTCFNCGETGHFWRNCPMHTAQANGATVGRFGNETYLQISVNGRKASCLLDTGCEKSMLPRRLIPNTPLQPVDISVYAANGIKIPILGSVRLQFKVEGMSLEAELLVSDAVEEMMLGIDWLTKYGCHWKFDDRVIIIGTLNCTSQPAYQSFRSTDLR